MMITNMKCIFLIALTLLIGHMQAQEGYWSKYADAGWKPAAPECKINTPEQFAQLAVLVNGGERFEDILFTLENDIDLSAHYWVPVGEESTYPFCGIFDGKNHSINGLMIDNNVTDYWGVYSALFGRLGNKACIKNVILASGQIKGGMGDGTLTASLVADILTEDDARPIQISACYNRGVVVTAGSGARGGRTGGLIASVRTAPEATGKTAVLIEACGNEAEVIGICTSSYTGGLIGLVSAGSKGDIRINDSYSSADVKGAKDSTGGLIGRTQTSPDANVVLTGSTASSKVIWTN